MWNSGLVSRSSRYVFALGFIALVTALLFPLRGALDKAVVALIYLIPLGLITAFWGLGPGITGALTTFLTFNYFFIPPYYRFTVHQPTDVVILVIFLIVAIAISQLVGRMQSGLAAATAREREATQLYELSTALAGLHDGHTIAEILARQVQEVSQGEAVELNIAGADSFVYRLPNDVPRIARRSGFFPSRWRAALSGRSGFGRRNQP
ncbi:MAG: DUF4118 domain-containing protein [Chloroflexi bacterium]|nr:DUF4118 domain-containing protein [Chloroflexota bacterium]